MKINTIDVSGFEGAIGGMRLPRESGDKSDSQHIMKVEMGDYGVMKSMEFTIGEADMKLCRKLIQAGSEHRKFLRMIHVQAEIEAPRYWLTELDTYKVGTVRNSSSTMHLITKDTLTQDNFEGGMIPQDYIDYLNDLIMAYNREKHTGTFLKIKRMLPESYLQKIVWDANYEVIWNIYNQRKDHRLPEWRIWRDWCETLPYFKEFFL